MVFLFQVSSGNLPSTLTEWLLLKHWSNISVSNCWKVFRDLLWMYGLKHWCFTAWENIQKCFTNCGQLKHSLSRLRSAESEYSWIFRGIHSKQVFFSQVSANSYLFFSVWIFLDIFLSTMGIILIGKNVYEQTVINIFETLLEWTKLSKTMMFRLGISD